MAKNRMSIATISSPEFINIEGISPLVSKCEIKVFYLGANRNGSFINKEVAIQMAQTLPTCPIVGYFSDNIDDFRDHGDQMVVDGDGIQFNCLTKPYGFVPPNARVWFQDFEDTDEFGHSEVRTYLMTEGYLWTEQYNEAKRVINEGRPQSMELDEKTLKGYWSTDTQKGIDFFIINDAIFSKLCILGEDVEPCFEGAEVTTPKVSSSFTLDDDFKRTLFSMMKELKELIANNKGGNSMDENKEYVVLDSTPVEAGTVVEQPETVVEQAPAEPQEVVIEPVVEEKEKISETEDKTDLENNIEIENNIEENFVKNSDEKKKEDNKESEEENGEEETEDDDKKKVSKNSLEEKYALLEQEYNDLKIEFEEVKAQNDALVAFKNDVEDKEKDALIESFYMLSDEDKKSVIENKSKYTLDDIEKELSVICVRKKVNFNLDEEKESTEKVVPTTFNLNYVGESDLPAWLKAVEDRRNEE